MNLRAYNPTTKERLFFFQYLKFYLLCLFFFKFLSHLGYYRILSRVPCAIQRSLLAIYFKYHHVYMSTPAFNFEQWALYQLRIGLAETGRKCKQSSLDRCIIQCTLVWHNRRPDAPSYEQCGLSGDRPLGFFHHVAWLSCVGLPTSWSLVAAQPPAITTAIPPERRGKTTPLL